MVKIWEAKLVAAAEHLGKRDATLATVIARSGPCRIALHDNYYQELVDAIISQQLSVKAAASIEKRFQVLFGGAFPTPAQILETEIETLRGVGLSRPKAGYIHDLARRILAGELLIDRLPELSNEEVTRELVAVKGIGEWTAHMFLIFSLGRLDVLPVGDLGIRNGMQKLYELKTLPDAAKIIEIAAKNHWHPYESVASWYVWQSLDNKPAV